MQLSYGAASPQSYYSVEFKVAVFNCSPIIYVIFAIRALFVNIISMVSKAVSSNK